MEVSKLIIPSNGEQVTVNIKDATARAAIAEIDGISPSDVEDKDATLSWGTKTEIATIGEQSIHVTLPSNPDTNAVTSVSGKTGVVTLDKSDVGLGNVDNTADANKSVLYAATAGAAPASDVYSWAKAENKPTYTKSEVGLGNVTNDAQVKRTEMGVAEGVATLTSAGKVPASQLPSFVDDIIEGYLDGVHFYSDSAHTTIVTDETGASSDQLAGKIYVDLSTNKTYRWGGSAYTIISSDIAIGNTTGTAADGGIVNTHVNDTNNPHSVTKAQVGLDNVTNDAQVKRTEMGTASGVATLNASGKVPDAQINASAISTQTILALFDGGIDDEDVVIGVPTADEDIEAMWDGYDPFDTEEEEEQQSNE